MLTFLQDAINASQGWTLIVFVSKFDRIWIKQAKEHTLFVFLMYLPATTWPRAKTHHVPVTIHTTYFNIINDAIVELIRFINLGAPMSNKLVVWGGEGLKYCNAWGPGYPFEKFGHLFNVHYGYHSPMVWDNFENNLSQNIFQHTEPSRRLILGVIGWLFPTQGSEKRPLHWCKGQRSGSIFALKYKTLTSISHWGDKVFSNFYNFVNRIA